MRVVAGPDRRLLTRAGHQRTAVVAKAGTSSSYNYYNGSWALMTLMLMTGNITPF